MIEKKIAHSSTSSTALRHVILIHAKENPPHPTPTLSSSILKSFFDPVVGKGKDGVRDGWVRSEMGT